MSKPSSITLPVLLALGAGALLGGLSAATQKERLPAIGGPRALLEGPQPVQPLEIGLGAELAEAGGRVRGTVEQVPEVIRRDLGFAPSHIAFKEDMALGDRQYEVRLRGLPIGGGAIEPKRLLALTTLEDADTSDLAGSSVIEPVSGRAGVWILEEDAGQARLLGYDVLDPEFVFALHVDALLRRHLYELLSREETYRLLDRARQSAPRTVEDLTAQLEVGLIQKVLQNLLREQVSLRDLPLVLELVADGGRQSKDPEAITEAVRAGLGRQLSAALADDRGVLHALPLGPRWEQLRNAQPGEPQVEELVRELRPLVKRAQIQGYRPILLAPGAQRAHVRRMLERALPDLPVLAEHEVDPGFQVRALPSLASVQ